MSQTISDNLSELKNASRFMLHSYETEAMKKGDEAAAKAVRAELEKDEAEISEGARSACSKSSDSCNDDQNVTIILSERANKFVSVSASMNGNKDNALFDMMEITDAFPAASRLESRDTVNSDGDGNDWFDSTKNLIWGATTGPAVNSKPSGTVNLEYYHEISQHMAVLRVDTGV